GPVRPCSWQPTTTPSSTPCVAAWSSSIRARLSATRPGECTDMALRVRYFFNETLQGLRRNGLVAFAAISTAFIALFLVGGALLVSREVSLLIDFTTRDVEVSVFLQKDISPSQQQHIGDLLGHMPEVASVHFESQQEAYQRF